METFVPILLNKDRYAATEESIWENIGFKTKHLQFYRFYRHKNYCKYSLKIYLILANLY